MTQCRECHFDHGISRIRGRANVWILRPFARFIGIALGGGRGKTTAVAELRIGRAGGVEVAEATLRAPGRPWTDDTLIERLGTATGDVALAFDVPLTAPACGRCREPVCPGMTACPDPAVVWLRTEGRALVSLPAGARTPQARLAPWQHRATDVLMTYKHRLLPATTLGSAVGSIASRAQHLVRRLAGAGFVRERDLIEVSPPATIAALCGERAARGYKRDADPWRTRAVILEQLADLTFAPSSRMAREEVLQNDHGFDAVITAYTAYRWARDNWVVPAGVWSDDGWVHAPASVS